MAVRGIIPYPLLFFVGFQNWVCINILLRPYYKFRKPEEGFCWTRKADRYVRHDRVFLVHERSFTSVIACSFIHVYISGLNFDRFIVENTLLSNARLLNVRSYVNTGVGEKGTG